MYQIQEEVDISAPIEVVWDLLMDLNGYSRWNSFVIDAKLHDSDTLKVGAQQTITVRMKAGGDTADYNNTITKVEQNREIRWRGALVSPIIFDTEHYMTLSPGSLPNSCRFVQGEKFTGLLIWLIRMTSTFEDLKSAYLRMNDDLKRAAERI
ncbi:hypothetical protein NA57DRAFT_62185 [Rhizodiscina lignyota]|uniref:SRPBCC domain-containing protein n=1 Tax=Rhizodiscina lignyota TaxID=1504668 RepID=A0A9P4I571_9PEZI|nr:hypothetical protein NA57DRAFT_62185 [Rhizodiscina lignyota]